ncbi:Sgta [Gossypium australe]|uniref:Sgta n=1 Tax=Gossypium australe TaxID=47621 RepID=A0A5B6UJA1_9ROSI|nr:Sgta [Gossypium australe]
MGKLKSDSPLSRRIVRSFLDFLDSVEPAPGVDLEGLEVARECLVEVFKLDSASINYVKPDLLIDIFSSLDESEDKKIKSDLSHRGTSDNATASLSAHDIVSSNSLVALKLGDNWTKESQSTGVSKDELFGQFFAAIEKIHFLRAMPDGNDDPAQLDKATRLFEDAVNGNSSKESFEDQLLLSYIVLLSGNRTMQSKQYSDAIELYSIAVSLCDDNAVYYCNRYSIRFRNLVLVNVRAAAYTQIQKYNEAIRDCHKSIEIDPNYSKAYSRLGLAYYAQGNYADAIEKGFKKALQLDPNNQSVKENIQVAEQKLNDEQQRAEWDQGASSSQNNQGSNNQSSGSGSHGGSSPFTMPFDASSLPTEIASMLMNMASSAYQGQPSQNRQGEDNINGSEEPGIRVGGNINLNFGEQMQIPEELTGAFRSVMEMFSGTPPHGNNQDTNGGSGSN